MKAVGNDIEKNNWLTDEDLVSLVSKDNREAFEELYNRNWQRLYKIACSKISNHQICEGIIQDLFVNLWTKRKKLVIKVSFQAYMNTALKYTILNHFDSMQVRDDYKLSLRTTRSISSTDTELVVRRNEIEVAIEKAVNQLPEKCQQVYRLSREKNLSVNEIAKSLNVSNKTVENHMTKALKSLKLSLKEFVAGFF